jgi:predicted transposase YbfD/YdcC
MRKSMYKKRRSTLEQSPTASIEAHFSELTDPRTGNATRHLFIDILSIAICAVICGAEGWSDIELFGKKKETWLRSFLQLPNGIPSHDTFGRVFAKINPQEFQQQFIQWVQAIETLTQGQVIAVDGKQLRGSHDREAGKNGIYLVSAWATANQLVLGQRKVDEKSNEITAIPQLLKLLEFSGCIVTIDAMGTQTKIAKTILAGGGDYVLAVKGNQGHLYEDLQYLFGTEAQNNYDQAPYSYTKTTHKCHGRIEVRECWAIDSEDYLAYLREWEQWAGLKSIACIISKRTLGDKIETQTQYVISSLPANAKSILAAKRSHWKIENQLHWVLDIAFREDHCRVRKDHAAENLSVLRQMALNLLNNEKSAKGGIHAKRLQAAWDLDYLLKVLNT